MKITELKIFTRAFVSTLTILLCIFVLFYGFALIYSRNPESEEVYMNRAFSISDTEADSLDFNFLGNSFTFDYSFIHEAAKIIQPACELMPPVWKLIRLVFN